jgi:sugar O-acyltransferase (sialic acid O-acetyltransferase NeuD family)
MLKQIGIIGFGSFTKEIICNIKKPFDIFISESYYNKVINELPNIEQYYKCKIFEINKFNCMKYKALVTIQDFNLKTQIINELPKNTIFYTYIDKRVHIMDRNIIIGEGSIICSGTILTTNIKLGKFTQLNLNTTIGHDTKVGDFFTTAPGVNISGNCNIGNNVYVGTNSSIREKINICDNVIIGLNSGVVKNIETPGIYTGTPCIKLIK